MLKYKSNAELLKLYDAELLLRIRNSENLTTTRKWVAKFIDYLGEFPPSPLLARAFLAERCQGLKLSSFCRNAQMIKSFMAWYGEPMEDFKLKRPKTLPDYVHQEDVDKLIEALRNKKTHKNTVARDLLLVNVALHSGLRRSELCNLRVRDVFPDFVVVRQSKGNQDRIVPLPPKIAKGLNNFVRGCDGEERVFGFTNPRSISGKVADFARKAGVPLHAHSFRHRYACAVLESGGNIRVLQQLLGHQSIETTQVYLAVTDPSLREAVNRLEQAQPPLQDETVAKKMLSPQEFKSLLLHNNPPARILEVDYDSSSHILTETETEVIKPGQTVERKKIRVI